MRDRLNRLNREVSRQKFIYTIYSWKFGAELEELSEASGAKEHPLLLVDRFN